MRSSRRYRRVVRTGKQAHRFTESKTVLRSGRLGRWNCSRSRLSLSRSTSTQRPRTGEGRWMRASRGSIFGLGQRFAVEGDAHLKSRSASAPRPDSRLPPTVAVTCGRGGRIRTPGGGNSNDDSGSLKAGSISQELTSLRGRPAQRMIDLSRVDHVFSHGQFSAARWTGRSNESSRDLFAGLHIRSRRGPAAHAEAWPPWRVAVV